jgi:toxin HigB-1
MIRSFGDAATEGLFHGHHTRRVLKYPRNIVPGALRKLDMINSAKELGDLRTPPGNRLETLKGDLVGFHSIRINDQWRVIFRWENREAREVTIIDYHS